MRMNVSLFGCHHFLHMLVFRNKKAELIQKKEQKQAAAQKQETAHKQMANYMGRYFKPIEKSAQVIIHLDQLRKFFKTPLVIDRTLSDNRLHQDFSYQ